jgi:subtilisin family serine protease
MASRKRKTIASRAFSLEQLEQRLVLTVNLRQAEFVPGEILVQYRPEANASQLTQARGVVRGSAAEVIHTRSMAAAGAGVLERVTLGRGVGIDQALLAIRKSPFVAYAERNQIFQAGAVSDDPGYTSGNLWGMYGDDSPASSGPSGTTNQFGSQAEKAWQADLTGSSNVFVGVIDEGLQVNHPDLVNNVWVNPYDPVDGKDNDGNGYIDDVNGWDFVSGNNTVYDGSEDDHGTHVAGTIGARGGNGTGVAGVAWNVSMISTKFLGPNGGTLSNAIKAIDYLTDLKGRHGLNIVASNNSWGGGGYSQALHDAIIRHAKADILFVAAAGNSSANNDTTAAFPSNYNTATGTSTQTAASYDAVISVASITSSGALSSFSSYGATTVDIGAPGSSIYSTLPGGGYGTYSGTSMATPHVTGAVAVYAAASPGSSGATIKSAILNSATPTSSLQGKTLTGGRLNVYTAVSGALKRITVSSSTPSATTTESGGQVSFTVSLSAAPTADVVISVASSNPLEGTVSTPSLVFTPENWATAQVVTVTGVDDAVYDGTVAYTIILGAVVSGDPAYNDKDPADVALFNADNDLMPSTRFYVVDDAGSDRVYEYAADSQPVENYAINSGNSAPRGIATTVVGDRLWVVDQNRRVYIYNTSGVLLGSWGAGSLAKNAIVEGIATNGTHVWIVDARADRVFYYPNAAGVTSGSLTAASSFPLAKGNANPKDIVTDGTNFWVVNDASVDQVFKYTLSGTYLSTWNLHSSNASPTGIAIDPSNDSQDIWVVDNATDRVYRYLNGRTVSSPGLAESFALAAGNLNPQGIADPPPASESGQLSAAGDFDNRSSAAVLTQEARPAWVATPWSSGNVSRVSSQGRELRGAIEAAVQQPQELSSRVRTVRNKASNPIGLSGRSVGSLYSQQLASASESVGAAIDEAAILDTVFSLLDEELSR